ncbi:MAG: class I SAM-dependent methyltransferase [Alphaproteobacteria bacterium]
MAHSGKHETDGPPSGWVKRFADRLPAGGAVLDLACGGGRHGRLFLEAGHPVTFVDADTAALGDLADHPAATIIQADLESGAPWPLGDRQFGGVVVTNYLWRPILPDIIHAVAPGGILIYETFAEGNEAFGRPRNPDFLLRRGELLEAVRGKLTVIAYGQCVQENRRVVQHIAAVRAA